MFRDHDTRVRVIEDRAIDWTKSQQDVPTCKSKVYDGSAVLYVNLTPLRYTYYVSTCKFH